LFSLLNAVDVPLHAILRESNQRRRELLSNSVQAGLKSLMAFLNEAFFKQTFVVGESLTVADISLYVSLTEVLKSEIFSFDGFPNVVRWYFTIGSHSSVGKMCPLPDS
jgi:glutathione S-transferase